MYKLIEFTTEKKYTKMFLSLPLKVYKGDKNYVKESKLKVKNWLIGNHPCAKFLIKKNLIVLKDNTPVARGIVFINQIGKFGSIGFFECLNDEGAVKLLADKAIEFCKAHSIKKIYATMNGSIWGDYRIMTKGFLDKPFMGEPYNKPYYFDVLIKSGFGVVKRWESQFVDDIKKDRVAKRIKFIAKLKGTSKITTRSMQNFDQDIHIMHKLVLNSFADFFLFHPIDEQTYTKIYGAMKRICNKQTLKLAFDKQNRPIGFGLAFPDYQSKLGFLFKHTKRYILWFFGINQKNGLSADPYAFKELVSPLLNYIYYKNKGCISAMISEDSKALRITQEYDYTHEYVLLETKVD